jgi:hypothetical protein
VNGKRECSVTHIPPIFEAAETTAQPNERRLLSRKEAAKEQRHAMYQRAKERQAADPRYLAMKEAVKEQRRAAYQKVKEHRKAVVADEKAKKKVERAVECTARRAETDRELLKFVTQMSKPSNAQE